MELPDLLPGPTVVVQATLCTGKDQWAQGVRQVKGWMCGFCPGASPSLCWMLHVCVVKAEFQSVSPPPEGPQELQPLPREEQ